MQILQIQKIRFHLIYFACYKISLLWLEHYYSILEILTSKIPLSPRETKWILGKLLRSHFCWYCLKILVKIKKTQAFRKYKFLFQLVLMRIKNGTKIPFSSSAGRRKTLKKLKIIFILFYRLYFYLHEKLWFILFGFVMQKLWTIFFFAHLEHPLEKITCTIHF